MSKLPTRFVIAFIAIGILVGAATTTTVFSGGLKPSNLAQAGGGGPPFGPNCVGCLSTQNLANGAVTNPNLKQTGLSEQS